MLEIISYYCRGFTFGIWAVVDLNLIIDMYFYDTVVLLLIDMLMWMLVCCCTILRGSQGL